MAAQLRAYTWREINDCFPPREVLDALGEPRHVVQGRVVVFAHTAKEAWTRLAELHMEPLSRGQGAPETGARKLAVATGNDVTAMIEAEVSEPGAVFAYSMTGYVSTAVVRVWSENGVRRVKRIGELVRGHLVLLPAFPPGTLLSLGDLEPPDGVWLISAPRELQRQPGSIAAQFTSHSGMIVTQYRSHSDWETYVAHFGPFIVGPDCTALIEGVR